MMRTRSRSSSRLLVHVYLQWWRAIALVALLAPMVAVPTAVRAQDAGSTPEAGPAYYSDTAGPPQPGGVVNFLLYEDPDSLNPLVGQTTIAVQVSLAILEGLTYSDPDGNFQTALAAELPTLENGGVSEDLKTVTWKLKPGLLWSDGEPVTSEDVKFTWEAARDAVNGSALASDYALITDVATPDPQTAA